MWCGVVCCLSGCGVVCCGVVWCGELWCLVDGGEGGKHLLKGVGSEVFEAEYIEHPNSDRRRG